MMIILAFVFFLEAVGGYTASRSIKNVMLYNVCWIYIESLLIVWYFSLLEKNPKVKRYFFIGFGAACLWGLINSLTLQPINEEFQYLSLLPMGLLIIGMAIRYYYSIIHLNIYPNTDLMRVPHIWITVGITFFYLEALTLFGYLYLFPTSTSELIFAWSKLNRIMAGIMYLSFGISFYSEVIFGLRKKYQA
ncbi:hypothetical protein [Echinicola pacifica]|nr:hypothetical protein [Echinicola pacifica]